MVERAFVLGVDIGGTNIRTAAVNQLNEPQYYEKTHQKRIFGGNTHKAGEALAQYLNSYITKNRLENKIEKIAIGFPSILDKERKVVLQTPNIEGLDGFEAVDFLQGALSLPVVVEKDVCMLLHYDLYEQSLSDQGIVIGCYVGTGFGNMILIDGKPLVGKDGATCELGHIHMPGRQETCGCGNVGCLENYGAGKYLEHLCNHVFLNTPIEELFVEQTNSPEVNTFLEHMAVGISLEINILNPDLLILGGGVLSMKGFPVAQLEKIIRQYTRKPLPDANLKLVYSKGGDYNGVLGAAIYARNMDKR